MQLNFNQTTDFLLIEIEHAYVDFDFHHHK